MLRIKTSGIKMNDIMMKLKKRNEIQNFKILFYKRNITMNVKNVRNFPKKLEIIKICNT